MALEKVEDKNNYVSSRIDFIEDMYNSGTITIKEANEWIRLIHEVVRKRTNFLIK